MGVILLAARLALAVVFTVAGIAKLRDPRDTRKSLADFGVPGALVPLFAVLLPFSEIGCAAGLFRDKWVATGGIGAAGLLVVFTVAIALNLARGRAPACRCFGQLSASAISWRTLVRNLALLALATTVIWKGSGTSLEWPSLARNSFDTAILVVAGTLTVMFALTLWLLFHLLQQNGRLMVRLETVEKRLNIDPNVQPLPGLAVGDPAPSSELASLDGRTMTLQGIGETGKPLLLVFSDPECAACDALHPDLALWQRAYAERMTIAIISRGEAELNRAKSVAAGLANVFLHVDQEVAHAYRRVATPSAVLIVEGQIASQIAAGPDAIRSLVAQTMLPPSVKRGDPVPSLKLQGLNGKVTDLSELRRALLLFWSPTCGFCQTILPYLNTWRRPADAPELVVISSGSMDENQKQGLRAKVLLDPEFGSGRVFGAGGTPSAVLLDDEGRVGSDLGVGALAVFALAGVEVPASLS